MIRAISFFILVSPFKTDTLSVLLWKDSTSNVFVGVFVFDLANASFKLEPVFYIRETNFSISIQTRGLTPVINDGFDMRVFDDAILSGFVKFFSERKPRVTYAPREDREGNYS
jgi:hypothetical protein